MLKRVMIAALPIAIIVWYIFSVLPVQQIEATQPWNQSVYEGYPLTWFFGNFLVTYVGIIILFYLAYWIISWVLEGNKKQQVT